MDYDRNGMYDIRPVLIKALCGRERIRMAQPKKVTAKYALSNFYSGITGEARFTAEFLRNGIQVAKPYWNDDEIDLLVFTMQSGQLIPIPIQVKTIQFLPNANNKMPNTKTLQGLKKKYIERQPTLCLAVYEPETDSMWLVAGASEIKAIYDEQYNHGRKQKKYLDINGDKDLPISWDRLPEDDFTKKYLVDKLTPQVLYKKISQLAKSIQVTMDLNEIYKRLFETYGKDAAEMQTKSMPLAGVKIDQ